MKNIIVMCCVLLIASVGVCNAQTKTRAGEVSFDTGGRGVVFKCVSPRDVLRGAGCYVLDTGGRVINGMGTIITAPFKAEWYFPRPRRYFYRSPQWKWAPGELTPLPYPRRHRSPPVTVPSTLGPSAPPPPRPDPVGRAYHLLYYPADNIRMVTS
jgi:hypothetical protein